ncbi:Hpt domain-containing protein, partial [Vibrio metschnikovii]|nr:Hpt domain-containing protein [Vibrio metschnikovii]
MQWMNTEKIDALAQEIGKENIPILMDIFLGELRLYHQQLTQGADGGNMT